MKKLDEARKNRLIDCIVILTAIIILISVCFVYFYNIFVKFQIDYATMYNQNVLSKTSKFNNDLIILSNAFSQKKKINSFLYDETKTYDFNVNSEIDSVINNSTLKTFINLIDIDIPKQKSVYSSRLKKKISHEEYKKTFSYADFVLKESDEIYTIERTENDIIYKYNTYRGQIISTHINTNEFSNYLFSHSFPIPYQSLLFSSDNQLITADAFENTDKLLNVIKSAKNNDTTYKNSYLIIKNSSKMYSSVSIIKISDIVKGAVQTSSFLFAVTFLFAILLLVIIYYFYYKKKNLILNFESLKKQHTDTKINDIIQKIFNKDLLPKSDEVILNDYFMLNNDFYFVPLIIEITNYKKLLIEYGYDELSVYKYGFENIITELLEETGKIKTVNMGQFIGVLLYSDNELDFNLIISKIKHYESVIKKHFGIDLATIVGKQSEDIISVRNQISQAINVLNCRFTKNKNIIFLFEAENGKNIEYPSSLQNEIITSINSKNKSGFTLLLNKFSDYMTNNNALNAKEMYFKLFFAISDHCRNNSEILIKNDAFDKMQNCTNISDMTSILLSCVKITDNKKSEDINDFEKKVKEIIEDQFSNPDFCIQTLIEVFDITASYFGKKFKQYFNMSFNRYLLEYRLKYALKLLDETNYTNAKIAKLCGFNSDTYFVTIFRKNIGLSPKDYKNKKTSENE